MGCFMCVKNRRLERKMSGRDRICEVSALSEEKVREVSDETGM